MKLINETTNEFGSTPGLIKRWMLRWIGKNAHVSTWYWGVLHPGGCRVFYWDELPQAEQLSRDFGSPVKKLIEIP